MNIFDIVNTKASVPVLQFTNLHKYFEGFLLQRT